MSVHINKANEIWPCYSLARNLFKHTYFLLIISLLFTHFPWFEVTARGQLGLCYRVFQYTGVDSMNVSLAAEVVELCCNCSFIIEQKIVPFCLKWLKNSQHKKFCKLPKMCGYCICFTWKIFLQLARALLFLQHESK